VSKDLFGGIYINEPFDAEYLRSLLEYNPDTGEWKWLVVKVRNQRKKGEFTGSRSNRRVITIDGLHYYASILAWLYMTGEWPHFEIDHKDRDPSNDRWSNLRLASDAQQRANIVPTARSGIKGVRQLPSGNWGVKIQVDQKEIWLGTFPTKEAAKEARREAGQKYFGEFDVIEKSEVKLKSKDLF
jgi:hypothetical protein